MIRSKFLFYLLSFTWGLPMTLIGCVVSLIMLATGHKPRKWGYCYYFEVGTGWGGVNFGPIFLTSKNVSNSTKSHEHGHGIQNCYFGPFMLVIGLLSVSRYWYREWLVSSGRKEYYELPDYDAAWYEGDATKRGTEFIDWYNTQRNN